MTVYPRVYTHPQSDINEMPAIFVSERGTSAAAYASPRTIGKPWPITVSTNPAGVRKKCPTHQGQSII